MNKWKKAKCFVAPKCFTNSVAFYQFNWITLDHFTGRWKISRKSAKKLSALPLIIRKRFELCCTVVLQLCLPSFSCCCFLLIKELIEIVLISIERSDGFTDPNVKKPAAPVMFLKPTSAYITEGQDIVVSFLFSLKLTCKRLHSSDSDDVAMSTLKWDVWKISNSPIDSIAFCIEKEYFGSQRLPKR